MLPVLEKIKEKIEDIAKAVDLEEEIFSYADANFRRTADNLLSPMGYVSIITSGLDYRLYAQARNDTAEMAPTFNLNPARTQEELREKL